MEGKVATQTLNGHTQSFMALRKSLKIPPRRNGLRHGFVTYHFALHQNENATSALAGNSPAMIHTHYKGLATKAEAEKWFAVKPGGQSGAKSDDTREVALRSGIRDGSGPAATDFPR